MQPEDRYVVISADGHAGATHDIYRSYLPVALHDEFDGWRTNFVTRWDDLKDETSEAYRRNFDSAMREAELDAEGIVAEVLYPNTVPPFAPSQGLAGIDPQVADRTELDRRWAGIHAHNQWLVDFCAESRGRRAGVVQLLFHDVDRAVEEVRWAAEQDHVGGVLIPNPSPGSQIDPLHSPAYEPIWVECEEVGLPVHTHSGGGVPDYGDHPSSGIMAFLEFGWYAYRPLVRLTMSGVFERHPSLRFVMTEGGWMPDVIRELDTMTKQIRRAISSSVEERFAGRSRGGLSLLPSEYWQRQCYLGASPFLRSMANDRHSLGVDRVMFGADYPHTEGTFPYTRQAYRHLFADVPPVEVAAILGGNAASAFGFDLDQLRPLADRVGPTVAEVSRPLGDDERPRQTTSMTFVGR